MTTLTLTKSEKINLDIKVIAKNIRQQLKKEFPEYKFAVNIERYSMGQALEVALMEAPETVFMELNERGYAQLNQYQFKDEWKKDLICNGTFLTLNAWECLSRVVEIVNFYNFDESDIQSDYFNVNFHFNLAIGKWDKPFIIR